MVGAVALATNLRRARLRGFFAAGAAAAAIMAAAPSAYAQQITANVRGTVTDANGAAVGGASITIVDTRTNRTTRLTTGGNGEFSASGLESGGPYSVTVAKTGFGSQRVEGVNLSISDTTVVSLQLKAIEAAGGEELVVVAAKDAVSKLAVGPNLQFTAAQVEASPSINRDLRDTLRYDPRILVTNAGVGNFQQNVSCLGGNNRSNSFTIDGVAQGDTFGLNASAFQGRFGNPYPIAATKELSVEYAPQDVQYSNFTGCAINVVTKSGTNEFHGGSFGEYTSDGLTGTRVENRTITTSKARNYRWGADLGGALIKDRVFFYVAYEQVKLGGTPQSFGPSDAGFATPQGFVNTALVNQIRDRIQQVYGYDAGGIVQSQPFTSRRILTRWDFNLTDRQRVAVTYNRFNEAQVQGDDGNSAQTFAFGSNFQTQGTKSRSYSVRWFSDWTDDFRTEFRVSRSDIQDIQNPLGGGEAQSADPHPRIVIGSTIGASSGILISGPGFSRAANDLRTQQNLIRGLANYDWNQHHFTVGFDWNQVKAFNLFVQNATGTLDFTSVNNFLNNIVNVSGNSTSAPNPGNIANAAAIFGQGRGDNANISGAAANWSRGIFGYYAQDKIDLSPDLSATIGLRYDRYVSGATPQFNAAFLARYGFDNSQSFNNLDVFQPRFAVNWDVPKSFFGTTNIQFGAGVFSGGDPAVFFSNVFSNTGFNFGAAQTVTAGIATPTCSAAQLAPNVLFPGGVFAGLPSCLTNAEVSAFSAGNGPVNAIDPNIKLPTAIRGNFQIKHTTDFSGAAHGAFDNWNLTLSYIHSAFRNSFQFVPVSQAIVGETAIGFPRYQTVDPLNAGCNLRFAGIGEGFTGTYTTACNGASSRNGDVVLTNVRGGSGDSDSLTFIADKTFDYSVFNVPSKVNVNFGYSYANAKDASNNGATTANSGVTSTVITTELNDLLVAPSGFFTPHNFVFAIRNENEFIKNAKTRVSAVLNARSGQKTSYTSQAGNIASALNNNALFSLYVPSSPLANGDPNVTYASTFDLAAFNQFIADNNLEQFRGQRVPRNFGHSGFFFDLDLHFEQEIPTPINGVKFSLYSNISNLLNLISSEANIQRSYGDRTSVVSIANSPAITNANVGGTVPVTYNTFNRNNLTQSITNPASLWQANFGVKLSF